MPQNNDPDELWAMRNQYYVGNFDGVLTEATSARLDDHETALLAEREFFIRLANLGKGLPISPSPYKELEFKGLIHFAALMNAELPEPSHLIALKKMVDEDGTGNVRLRVIAGLAFSKFSDDPNDALRILHSCSNSLEALHITCSNHLPLSK